MADHGHADAGVGLLAFILGGVVVLVLAIALFLFLGGDQLPGGGSDVTVPLPSAPAAAAGR